VQPNQCSIGDGTLDADIDVWKPSNGRLAQLLPKDLEVLAFKYQRCWPGYSLFTTSDGCRPRGSPEITCWTPTKTMLRKVVGAVGGWFPTGVSHARYATCLPYGGSLTTTTSIFDSQCNFRVISGVPCGAKRMTLGRLFLCRSVGGCL
jgi:hypothetical protein